MSNKELLQYRGIIPDIVISYDKTIKDGKDLALEAAIKIL